MNPENGFRTQRTGFEPGERVSNFGSAPDEPCNPLYCIINKDKEILIFPVPGLVPHITPTNAGRAAVLRRPEIIKFYPDVPSRVVRARHSGAWVSDQLDPQALGQMLDASITKLTGLEDAGQAWKALFDPDECVAIKVNTIAGSSGWTHVPLVNAVAERLQAAGLPPEQIFVYDRSDSELSFAGFNLNKDKPGVRCFGTQKYQAGYTVAGTKVSLTRTLLDCDALINMPILKQHMRSALFFHEEISIQSEVWLGGENLLGLSPQTDGVIGRYQLEGAAARLLLVRYPDAGQAAAALEKLEASQVKELIAVGANGSLLGAVFGKGDQAAAKKLLDAAL